MKIGILTLPLHTNYGGILQAYALQTVLERMGHNVKVIDKSRYHFLPFYKKPFIYVYRILLKVFLRKNIKIQLEKYYNECIDRDKITQIYTRPFIDKNIHQKHIEKFSEIKQNDFDAIVVGSDQIWRTIYANLFFQSTTAAYLDFAQKWDNLKRVAYAASFGTDRWEYTKENTKKCRNLISKFNAVSVREKNGISLCCENLNYKNAIQVLDPTLLLDASDYERLFRKKLNNKKKGGLFCYILDPNEIKNSIIKKCEQNYKLKAFHVNSKVDDWNAPMEERIQPPVEEWLQGIADADFVITDSFHACAFSIIFKKQFLVIGNEKRGLSRFTSFLDMFDLKDRLIVDKTPNDNLKCHEINYDEVYKELSTLRSVSFEFLKNNLQ